jgi:hypothetical protein
MLGKMIVAKRIIFPGSAGDTGPPTRRAFVFVGLRAPRIDATRLPERRLTRQALVSAVNDWLIVPRGAAAYSLAHMIRIAVSPRAYRAIKDTLPEGSVVYPPERNSRGQYLLLLSEAEANRLSAIRKPGESVSAAVIRLATRVSR